MNKLQLVLSNKVYTSFNQPWIVDMVKDYFDIVYIENNPQLDKKALFVTSVGADQKWCNPWHKLIIDNLWEKYYPQKQGLVLTNKNWFWYNESLWYQNLNYHTYTPNIKSKILKNGLLLMNIKKPHRDLLLDRLDLDKLLYSYIGNGIRIDNDVNFDLNNVWQRYFNPIWYESTAFSIVAETLVTNDVRIFVTEKTFKPIAFRHPFIILGQPGILSYLKSQGFETFENIFDESYDTSTIFNERLNKIVQQVNNFVFREYDSFTKQKLEHNRNLFFNQTLVQERIIKEIFEPMLEYAET
jgi:hypothetical protein